MKVRFKKLDPSAVTPAYAKAGDAGLDLTATSIKETDEYIQYGTGIAVEIPEGNVGLLFPRSSVTELGLIMKNSVGVIDSGYRGEIKVRFSDKRNPNNQHLNTTQREKLYDNKIYKVGDRVGQLIIVPIPAIELEEAEELSNTERSTGGYGSTGK